MPIISKWSLYFLFIIKHIIYHNDKNYKQWVPVPNPEIVIKLKYEFISLEPDKQSIGTLHLFLFSVAGLLSPD